MSATGECPDRVAIETPRGSIRAGPVVECSVRVVDCHLVPHVSVAIGEHTFEVPAHEAQSP